MNRFEGLMRPIWRIADTAGAEKALCVLAFAESIFFPVPPDFMLIPMCLANREKCFRYAWLLTAFSVIGGVAGYAIGHFFMEAVGNAIVGFYGFQDEIVKISGWYDAYDAWAVAIAGLTPVPYKVCTLTAGMFKISFAVFMIASVLSRGARFFAVAGLIHWQGERVRGFLEKRFDLVLLLGAVLIVLGFLSIRWMR